MVGGEHISSALILFVEEKKIRLFILNKEREKGRVLLREEMINFPASFLGHSGILPAA